MPFTKPLKLYVDGWYGPTKLMSLVGRMAALEAGAPQAGVDEHPPKSVVQQILRRAVRRREHAARFAGRRLVGAHPDDRLLFLACAGGESGVMPSRICPVASTWLPSIGSAV